MSISSRFHFCLVKIRKITANEAKCNRIEVIASNEVFIFHQFWYSLDWNHQSKWILCFFLIINVQVITKLSTTCFKKKMIASHIDPFEWCQWISINSSIFTLFVLIIRLYCIISCFNSLQLIRHIFATITYNFCAKAKYCDFVVVFRRTFYFKYCDEICKMNVVGSLHLKSIDMHSNRWSSNRKWFFPVESNKFIAPHLK